MARTKGGRERKWGKRQPDAEGAARAVAEAGGDTGWRQRPRPPLSQPGPSPRPRAPAFLREGGRVSPAGGALEAAFVQRPRAGEGAKASTAEQRAPESARRAPAPQSGRPLPSPSGALFVPAPGPGPEGAAGTGGEVAGAGAARGTYVSLWSSARRSLGTLRRWDSRLRRPSTVSSGGTDSS